MPVVFVHGVNTRKTDANYEKDLAARRELMTRLVLEPLAERGGRFTKIDFVAPYWGDLGVSFSWNQATLPDGGLLEHLGAEEAIASTAESDAVIAATVAELGGATGAGHLESLGTSDGAFKRAAQADLSRFLEAVVSPIVLSEMSLLDPGEASAEERGVSEALLAIAVRDVGKDPAAAAAVSVAGSDDEVLSALKQRIFDRLDELSAPKTGAAGGQLESLGSGFLDGLKTKVGEMFDRAKDAPARALTLPAIDMARGGLHGHLSRFFGDVLVYINDRGDREHPGAIVELILEALRTPPNHPDEPLIVMTHSMGGNVIYDILTHFAPDLKVDVWVSVGGQVGQFEEMKLFLASDKKITGSSSPSKVSGLKPRVGYWLNVYDPADIFGFRTAPVFADVDADVLFKTGAFSMKAHSAYFSRASFWDMVREHIEKTLP